MQQEFYDAMYQIESEHWWFRAKSKIVMSILDKYFSTSQPNKPVRLLDAGCGCGLMLNVLQHYGETEGMDFSDTAIQYCKKSFNGKLRQWDLNIPLEFEYSFNAIIALDVLEHIINDQIALKTLANGLKNGGIAVVTVPANPWMWSEHDRGCMHQRRYTKKGLKKICESANLRICYLSYYNFYLFFPIVCMRVLEKILPFLFANKGSIENILPPFRVNKILYSIFQSEHKKIIKYKRFPFGVSLIAVLQKE